MLLHKSEPFTSPDWIFEPKMDGIRIILSKINDKVKIFTRHKNDVTNKYPELYDIPVKEDIILDGEIICYDPITKQVDFELCMERFMTQKPEKMKRFIISYVAFDILHYAGKDLRNSPLNERKEILHSVLKDSRYISKIRHIKEHGEQLFEAAKDMDLEGIVAKKTLSCYEGRRSNEWLKIINWKYEDIIITGYKKGGLGWGCAIEKNGRLQNVGFLEFGMTPNDRRAFYSVTQNLIKKETQTFVYLEPRIRAKVKYRNWTKNKMLRTPVFCSFIF